MRLIISILSVSLLSLGLIAQDSPQRGDIEKQNKDYKISVDVELVQLPVSVLDKDGHPVNGLTKDNFQVFEDGTQQQITLFKHEDVPISLGLIIDNSGSMRNKRERVNSAALTFVRESNPEDETFIVNFDDSAYLEQDFTSSIGDLTDALDNLDTRGETALYDAIYLSADHVKDGGKDKKALLLITDGEDNRSKYGFNKVMDQLRESKVTLYAIGLLEENDQRGGLFKKPPSKKAKENLEQFAAVTGGLAFFPKSLDEVEELCQRIAHDLRNHYTLGYTPTNRKLDGTWRKIDLRVTPPKNLTGRLMTRTKPGYTAPRDESISSSRSQ
jgi:Ca-activated chloride channel family protein